MKLERLTKTIGTWGYLTVTVSSGGGPGGAISEA